MVIAPVPRKVRGGIREHHVSATGNLPDRVKRRLGPDITYDGDCAIDATDRLEIYTNDRAMVSCKFCCHLCPAARRRAKIDNCVATSDDAEPCIDLFELIRCS